MKKLYYIFTYVESKATKFVPKKLNFDDNEKTDGGTSVFGKNLYSIVDHYFI